jgi:pimeloyl-ACP methyl ester carboxylesterase
VGLAESVEVRSGEAALACESGGAGHPETLLLHAGVTDRRSWQHLTPRLPGRWVAYDARCYGESRHARDDGWSFVGDAVAVLDAYGIDRAALVAGSLGGRTALDLALTHPDRVSALVLVAPAISGAPRPDIEPGALPLVEAAREAEEAGDVETTNRLEAHVWLDGPLQREGRVGGATRELFLAMNRIPLSAEDPGDREPDAGAWDRLGEIRVPTLVLVGEHDVGYLHDWGRRLADTVADGRYRSLPGVAHLPQLEGDRHTLEVIAGFLADRG